MRNLFNFFDWENDYFYQLLNLFPRPLDLKTTKDNNAFRTNYLQVLDKGLSWPEPKLVVDDFKFDEELNKWVYKVQVGKDIRPEDIEVQTNEDRLNVFYYKREENSSISGLSALNIPGDPETIKGKLKGGVLTITCDPKPEPEVEECESSTEFDPEQEYEIEIG